MYRISRLAEEISFSHRLCSMEFKHCNASSCQMITTENRPSLQYPFTIEYVHLNWRIKHQ